MEQLVLKGLEYWEHRIEEAYESAFKAWMVQCHAIKQIRDEEAYKAAGYNSIEEYAERRWNYTRTTTNRMIDVCEQFSKGGNSPELDDSIRTEKRSMLLTLLSPNLDKEDYKLICEDTKVKDMEQLAKLQGEYSEGDQVEGQMSLIQESDQRDILDAVRKIFRPREEKERLDNLFRLDPDSDEMKYWANDFNYTGNRMIYNSDMFPFIFFFYSDKEGIKIKNLKTREIEERTYKDFYFLVRRAFGREAVNGSDIWQQAFGAAYEEEQRKKQEEERIRKQLEEQKKKVVNQKKTESRKSNSTESIPQPKDIGTSEEKPISEKVPEIKASEPLTEPVKEEESQATEPEETNEPQKEVENPVCEVAQTRISSHTDGNSEDVEKEPEITSEELEHEVVSGEVEDEHIVHLIIPEYQAIAENSKKFLICKNNVQVGDVIVIRVKFNRAFSDIKAKVTYREKNTGLMQEYTAYGIEVVDEEE